MFDPSFNLVDFHFLAASTGSQTAQVSHLLEGDRARFDDAFPYPIAETASDVQAALALPDLH
jgi:hypothetical protein